MSPVTRSVVAAMLFAVPCLPALAQSAEPVQTAEPVQPGEPVSSMDIERETASAQIVAADPATRVISLKTGDGQVIDVRASDDLPNFNQIKAGDVVAVTLQRSLTYTVSPEGTKLPSTRVVDQSGSARPGEKPAGVAARSTSLTGVIVAVDPAGNTVSVVDQSGGPVHVLEVHDPERQAYLSKITPGSLLTATYTSVAVLQVHPAGQ